MITSTKWIPTFTNSQVRYAFTMVHDDHLRPLQDPDITSDQEDRRPQTVHSETTDKLAGRKSRCVQNPSRNLGVPLAVVRLL